MLKIQSKSHLYAVEQFKTLEEGLEQAFSTPNVFTLIDKTVLDLYQATFSRYLNPNKTFSIEASEDSKRFEELTPVFTWLIETGFRRDCTLLVIGGGVLQDIGAYVSTTFRRGIRWEFIPTTLLSQCDSCIGSKSSINIGEFKNQLGTFYPPHRILLIPEVLQTLPPDEIRSGIGEIIKLHYLSGDEAVKSIEQKLAEFKTNPEILQSLIWTSLEIKKPYIEEDEFDQGIRNLLNYGHTFGHAYESATHYQIPHGIGVTLGMLTALFFSESIGWLPQGSFQAHRSFLEPFYHPYENLLTPDHLNAILSALKQDKKNTGNNINCILTRGNGKMEKKPLALEKDIQPLMTQFLATLNPVVAVS